MIQLRFFNRQWHDPEGKWPYRRDSMFAIMDANGRTVTTRSPLEDGSVNQSHTYYHNNQTQQNFYPLSARRKRG